jgi:hypothetical protein
MHQLTTLTLACYHSSYRPIDVERRSDLIEEDAYDVALAGALPRTRRALFVGAKSVLLLRLVCRAVTELDSEIRAQNAALRYEAAVRLAVREDVTPEVDQLRQDAMIFDLLQRHKDIASKRKSHTSLCVSVHSH